MGFLSGFSGTPERGPDSTPTRISAAISERIRRSLGIKQLECMPAQAARAFQLASDPRATGADFIEVIESDDALSSRILRIANSVYFFRGTHASDIEKAVANIGLDELRCILSAAMLKSLLQGKHPLREQVWANAVATAICCRTLSRLTPQIAVGEAFLCGLVHDIGKLIMIRRDGESYRKVNTLVTVERKSFLEAEEAVYGLNHAEVGQWVAENWNFPPRIIRAVSKHHLAWPKKGSVSVDQISTELLVKIADTIAHALGIGHPTNFRSVEQRFTDELPDAFACLRLTPEEGTRLIEPLTKEFETEYSLYQLDHG